jgi:hypothetical protein
MSAYIDWHFGTDYVVAIPQLTHPMLALEYERLERPILGTV